MSQECSNCGKKVEGLVSVAGPEDLYNFYKTWCFACVYEKGLADYNKRKDQDKVNFN
jgi:hypothetical protein